MSKKQRRNEDKYVMKWNNKGHELDYIGNFISCLENVYIFGAGINGNFTYEILHKDITIKAFVDNDIEKKGTIYYGTPVIGVDELISVKEKCVIVVATSKENTPIIIKQLEDVGFLIDVNIFDYWRFIQIFEMYRNNKVYLTGCTLSITEKCSLNCEKCSILTPYITNPKHYELQRLQADVKLFFLKIDYIRAFNLLGGEPFLFSELSTLVKYIGENYNDKIGKITLTTNGMIMPNEDLIQVMKRYQVVVSVSDYRDAIPQISESVSRFIYCLRDRGIEIVVDKVDQWIDFGYEYVNRKNSSDEEIQELFERCNTPCRLLQDGIYYYCANSRYAQRVGLISRDVENEFDLKNMDNVNKKQLLEFDYGYNNKGYIKLCKKCNGYLTINNQYIEVAKQCRKKSIAGENKNV